MSVSGCLEACSGCSPAFTLWQLGRLQQTSGTLSAGESGYRRRMDRCIFFSLKTKMTLNMTMWGFVSLEYNNIIVKLPASLFLHFFGTKYSLKFSFSLCHSFAFYSFRSECQCRRSVAVFVLWSVVVPSPGCSGSSWLPSFSCWGTTRRRLGTCRRETWRSSSDFIPSDAVLRLTSHTLKPDGLKHCAGHSNSAHRGRTLHSAVNCLLPLILWCCLLLFVHYSFLLSLCVSHNDQTKESEMRPNRKF